MSGIIWTDNPTTPVLRHDDDCDSSHTCVECDGCDCGLIPATCVGPCYSAAAYREWQDQNGPGESW